MMPIIQHFISFSNIFFKFIKIFPFPSQTGFSTFHGVILIFNPIIRMYIYSIDGPHTHPAVTVQPHRSLAHKTRGKYSHWNIFSQVFSIS